MYNVIMLVAAGVNFLFAALNLRCCFRWRRMRKRLEAKEEYCATMITACADFMETHKDLTSEGK